MPGTPRLELRWEVDLDAELKARCGELLIDVFGNERARGRGWISSEPLYRVLAFAGDDLVGQRMTCWVANDQGLRILGFGDLAVLPPYRRQGLARAMTERGLVEALMLDADALMTMTVRMAPLYRSLGFRAGRPGEFVLVEEGRLEREEDPWVRWLRPERARALRYFSPF